MTKPKPKLVKKGPVTALPFKIENGVPLPSKKKENPYKAMFAAMSDSDSFLIGNDDKLVHKLQNYARAWGKENDATFAFRKTEEGHRCWRIK